MPPSRKISEYRHLLDEAPCPGLRRVGVETVVKVSVIETTGSKYQVSSPRKTGLRLGIELCLLFHRMRGYRNCILVSCGHLIAVLSAARDTAG